MNQKFKLLNYFILAITLLNVLKPVAAGRWVVDPLRNHPKKFLKMKIYKIRMYLIYKYVTIEIRAYQFRNLGWRYIPIIFWRRRRLEAGLPAGDEKDGIKLAKKIQALESYLDVDNGIHEDDKTSVNAILCVGTKHGNIPSKFTFDKEAFYVYDGVKYPCNNPSLVEGEWIFGHQDIPRECAPQGYDKETNRPIYNGILVTDHGNIPGSVAYDRSSATSYYKADPITQTSNFAILC